MPLPIERERFSFADILSWDEGKRIEIIEGEAFMMATPSTVHIKAPLEAHSVRGGRKAATGN